MSTNGLSSSRKRLQVARQVWPLVKNYYIKAREAKRGKKLIAWHLGVAPYEILRGVDAYPIMPEHYASVLTAKQKTLGYLDLADNLNYSKGICSIHRVIIGYSLSGEDLMIPNPDFILASDNPCDATSKTSTLLANHFNIPYYYLSTPYHSTIGGLESLEDETVKYYASQLREMISLIEEITGKKTDEDRLRTTIELASKAYSIWMEINELRKEIPCPMSAVEEVGTIYPLMQLAGTKEAVGFYEMLLAEVKERVRGKKGVVNEEGHRLLWVGPAPWYDTGLLNYFEELGALLVKTDVDIIFAVDLDPDNPLESMARKMVTHYYNSIIENRIEAIKKMIKDYFIDGVIMYSNFGCRRDCGGQRALQDALYKQMGTPSLILEGDVLDIRNYQYDKTRERIENFLESI